ncbi:hypothetical protein LINGRAPRIM_LOCUS150 [Linum grandiflorum]
MVSINLSIVFR